MTTIDELWEDYSSLQKQNFNLVKTIKEKDAEIEKFRKENERLSREYNIDAHTGKIPIPPWIEADFKGIEARISELYNIMNLVVARINMTQYKNL